METGKHHSEETKKKISEANRGRVFTEEHRQKLSRARAGKPHTEEHRRRNSEANKGRVFTEEHRQHIREACKGMRVGERNPNWQGGVSLNPYPLEFNDNLRDLVRERDGYICQMCGKTQSQNRRKLAVHHIDYDKENNDLGNLVSLCNTCHPLTNFDRERWVDYFG